GESARGDRKPLALARGQVTRVAIELPGQADLPDRLACARLVGAQGDLVEHTLGDEVAARILAQVGRARVPDLARCGLEQAACDLRERRLPGAVRPSQGDDLAAAHLE